MELLPKYVDTWIVKRTGEQHYLCKLCGRVDDDHGNEAEFQRHLSSWHHKIRIMQRDALHCKVCDIQFHYPSSLKKHLASKSHKFKEDPSLRPEFKCDICNVTFSYKIEEMRHLASKKHAKRANPPTEGDSYCKVCERDYKFHSQLLLHFTTAKHLAKTDLLSPRENDSPPPINLPQ